MELQASLSAPRYSCAFTLNTDRTAAIQFRCTVIPNPEWGERRRLPNPSNSRTFSLKGKGKYTPWFRSASGFTGSVLMAVYFRHLAGGEFKVSSAFTTFLEAFDRERVCCSSHVGGPGKVLVHWMDKTSGEEPRTEQECCMNAEWNGGLRSLIRPSAATRFRQPATKRWMRTYW